MITQHVGGVHCTMEGWEKKKKVNGISVGRKENNSASPLGELHSPNRTACKRELNYPVYNSFQFVYIVAHKYLNVFSAPFTIHTRFLYTVPFFRVR